MLLDTFFSQKKSCSKLDISMAQRELSLKDFALVLNRADLLQK